jgi:two-component system nitrogen regulation sensor histidine kinase NtrY
MWPRISRFERRIIAAIFLSALVPFLISLAFIPQIIETRLALSMHSDVKAQLEASAVFFKEFFDAKKREYSARAEAISRDPVLIRAAQESRQDEVQARLQQVLDDNPEIRSLAVIDPTGVELVRLAGPPGRQGPDFVPKTIALPLGVGDAPRLEAEFILPKRYMVERAHAEEIATLYDASLRTEDQRSRTLYWTYFSIAFAVMVLALGVGFYLARSVTRRIAHLAAATERVARGESGFTVPVGGDDEITELTDGFNKMIEEVAEARDRIVYLEKVSGWQEFARRLAHEIKNPLTPIRLAIQELQRRAPAEDPGFKRLVDDSADVVEEEIGSLTRLVDEFSNFARLPEVHPVPLEVNTFVEEFLTAYNRFEPDAEVQVALPERTPVAPIDRVMLKRVLFNLVTNAIQAAGKGRAKVWLRATTIPATQMVELRVEDNGPGVPLDQAEKIFEPYFTTKAEGTGLGLAIVKKIVLQHRGSISLRRAPGGGAAFVILLPPAPKGAVPERSEAEEEAKEIARRSQTRLPAITEE